MKNTGVEERYKEYSYFTWSMDEPKLKLRD